MKKFLILCLVLLMATPVFAKDITITLDGKEIKSDVAAYIEKDRTLVPIRFISENLGYGVKWNNETRVVTISDSNKKIELKIDSKDINVDGKISKMDVAPVIKKDRTFVPLRFVAEYMGLNVDWDAKTYTVILKTTQAKPYISEINSLLKELNLKNEELKKYFYAEETKHSRNEIESKFEVLRNDIQTILDKIRNMNVPAENTMSHKLILEASDLTSEILKEYRIGILDGDSSHARKIVELQTKLAVKTHEVANALEAEKNGKVYTPDVDTQIFNRAGEIDKNKNPLDDELIQNLLKKI
ncbi:Copper amine oxidase N-terminal domain-containing protein [Peptoniphilus asaccharolyticus DSM 20463]|uniref:Copper amine oxidase N-terminal domain-containing protein n=1 Tax=Peptoniphilus asaccharolyticus DSM 20463 TaxID=573058 RepID=A0A1W1VDG2_PEPAS|nr:copper amine oxidase N-terminal domain-containing protein [Peptoniphilus asaccharolyticus]MBL7574561.1 copper amine oxidase N-terminal domain-containing protein [Peptoniphilus asaccharolyticus]SMB91408.1 Copper amine oxidase N-terminal domain-containing protein [Peptoniphilus asaccharolyticus DSM 20463]